MTRITRCRPDTRWERFRREEPKEFWRDQGAGWDVDILCVIRTSGRAIGGVLGTRDVIEDKVITRQNLGPAGLTAIQNLRGHERFEVFVIGANVDRMQGSFKVVAPVFEAFYNGEHFAIVDVVIAFRRDALPGPKCDRV